MKTEASCYSCGRTKKIEAFAEWRTASGKMMCKVCFEKVGKNISHDKSVSKRHGLTHKISSSESKKSDRHTDYVSKKSS